jgi:hypothetical protein
MDIDVDDGAMDNSSQSDDGQGVPHARALRPTARSIAPSMGELKGEALHDFAMACYRRARDKANAAIGAKKARAPAIRQWLRAFGLASNDPENIEEYAIEAGIEPPETLREALGTERGAKIGIAMETPLRNSGELAHVSFARMMHKAVAAVAKGLDDGSVSAAAASKISWWRKYRTATSLSGNRNYPGWFDRGAAPHQLCDFLPIIVRHNTEC